MTTPHNPFQTDGEWPGPDPLVTEQGVVAANLNDDYPITDPLVTFPGDPTATVPVVPQRDLHEQEPIPVRIVSTEQPTQVRRRGSASNVWVQLANQLNAGQTQAVRVLQARANRTKARLVVKNKTGANAAATGRVWITWDDSPNPSAAPQTMFPMDYGDTLDLTTTDDVWAVLDPAAANDAIVAVVEEWEVTLPIHSDQTEHKLETHRL